MKWALLCLALAGVRGCRSAGQNPVLSTSSSAPDTSPYAMWNNGPSPDPAYFPIGVRLQNPHRAQTYQAIGSNVGFFSDQFAPYQVHRHYIPS